MRAAQPLALTGAFLLLHGQHFLNLETKLFQGKRFLEKRRAEDGNAGL
jgi:hypothetical protein